MSTNDTEQVETRLLAEHIEVLSSRGIGVEYAQKLGLRTISQTEADAIEKIRNKGGRDPFPGLPVCAGLLIPYPDGEHYRLRVDKTEFVIRGSNDGSHHEEKTGKRPRYFAQKGAVVPYITPEAMAVAADTSAAIYITEAPLKAMSLSCNGYPAIGLGGVLAGAHDTEALRSYREIAAHKFIRDKIDWRGRTAYVVFDAGLTSNHDVARGAAFIFEALRKLGADLRLVTIPYFHAAESDPTRGHIYSRTDQGPDDYIARSGVSAFQVLVEESVPLNPCDRITAIRGESIPGEEKTRRILALIQELPTQAVLSVGGPTMIEWASGAAGRLLGKSALKQQAKAFTERGNDTLGVDESADDVELARLLIEKLGHSVFTEGAFFKYEFGVWNRLDLPDVRCRTHDFSGAIHLTDRKIKGIVNTAADIAGRNSLDFFSESTTGLAFSNGFLTISKSEIKLVDHSPDHRARHRYDWDYKKDAPHPTRFLAMLERWFRGDSDSADKIAALQEHLGRGLFGLGARDDGKALVLVGEGDDGKSTLCDLYQALMPKNSVCCIAPQMLGHEYYRAQLAGKLLNVVADAPTTDILETGNIKAPITGDGISGRNPGEKPFDFRSIALNIWSFNRKLPPVKDRTGGMRKRFLIIRFNNAIPKAEQVSGIEDAILTEEKAAIVAWLVEGAQRSLTKLTMPASSLLELQKWFDDTPVAHFVNETSIVHSHVEPEVKNGVPTNGKWKKAEVFFKEFQAWYEANYPAGRIVSSKEFGERLTADLKVPRLHTERGNWYAIELKADEIKEADANEAAAEYDAASPMSGNVIPFPPKKAGLATEPSKPPAPVTFADGPHLVTLIAADYDANLSKLTLRFSSEEGQAFGEFHVDTSRANAYRERVGKVHHVVTSDGVAKSVRLDSEAPEVASS